ncbi:unnamed protein product [Acanthoscelides obtectus]|uniref:Uncharacterized protein n=1 Tax=Acanthoscelides obtectus TaxID=200917 RepID=A0A9P0VTV6_ACAOB|nr:unnamed protein product [Acanthoscelides obtectus]CAH2018778.1 unnamed protein product [Acanthoscelides obtectus]CAH2020312.1 unnamed protein product [Acanthoscelides obtectus]CAH2020320.1 unnamed protein product [Acanthoscelides obtectus]CAH2020324.1 unnamed protein product [Acanthoscelides obtectus]
MLLQCLQQLNCLLSERCTNLNTYFQGHTFYHSRLQGHISRLYFKVAFQGHISRPCFKVTFQGHISRLNMRSRLAPKVDCQGRSRTYKPYLLKCNKG